MKRAIKVLGITVGIIVVLIAATALVVALLFDPNQYKSQISKLVTEKTGREFQIKGDLDFNIFPWIGLKANEITMGNPSGFPKAPFASVESIRLRIRLIPLLRKRLEAGRIILKGVTLHLIRTKDGANNWEDLLPSQPQPSTTPQAETGKAPSVPMALAGFTVGGVSLENSKLILDDAYSDRYFTVHDMNIRSGRITSKQYFPVHWEFNFQSKSFGMAGHCALYSRVSLDMIRRRVQIKDLSTTISLKKSPFARKPLKIKVNGGLYADLANQRLKVEFREEALNLVASGHFQAKNIVEYPTFSGEVETEPFDLKEFLSQLGKISPSTSDPNALSKIAMRCSFSGSPKQINLSNLNLVVDDTTLKGHATIKLPRPSTVSFEFSGDRIDLDHYLPGSASSPGSKKDPSQPTSQSSLAAPSTRITAFPDVANGTLTMGFVKIHQMRISNLLSRLTLNDGLLRITTKGNLYDGSFSSIVSLNKQAPRPKWNSNIELQHVAIGNLLKDTKGKSSISGLADLTANLYGEISKKPVENLNGNLKVKMVNVKTAGLDIKKALEHGSRGLIKRLPKLPAKIAPTIFDELKATALIKNGVLYNSDLVGYSESMDIRGKGEVSLVSKTIDYLITATIKKSPTDSAVKLPKFLLNTPLPLRIFGPLDKPIISLDLREVLRTEGKKKILHHLKSRTGILPRLFGPRP